MCHLKMSLLETRLCAPFTPQFLLSVAHTRTENQPVHLPLEKHQGPGVIRSSDSDSLINTTFLVRAVKVLN